MKARRIKPSKVTDGMSMEEWFFLSGTPLMETNTTGGLPESHVRKILDDCSECDPIHVDTTGPAPEQTPPYYASYLKFCAENYPDEVPLGPQEYLREMRRTTPGGRPQISHATLAPVDARGEWCSGKYNCPCSRCANCLPEPSPDLAALAIVVALSWLFIVGLVSALGGR